MTPSGSLPPNFFASIASNTALIAGNPPLEGCPFRPRANRRSSPPRLRNPPGCPEPGRCRDHLAAKIASASYLFLLCGLCLLDLAGAGAAPPSPAYHRRVGVGRVGGEAHNVYGHSPVRSWRYQERTGQWEG